MSVTGLLKNEPFPLPTVISLENSYGFSIPVRRKRTAAKKRKVLDKTHSSNYYYINSVWMKVCAYNSVDIFPPGNLDLKL